jgi:hypothetical protein
MPTFDGGHYFLTVLAPIRTDTLKDGAAHTSPVHALRKRLQMLATAAQTPASGGRQSAFTKNMRNHFVRFVIIDDVAYNGRDQANTFVNLLSGDNPVIAQPQDHLSCPFLLFAVDFDAASGADIERDSYLAELWSTMRTELHDIFRFCRDFEGRVKDASSFAKYIADCQLETTMSFNDYYAVTPDLPAWPAGTYKWGIIASGGATALGLFATLILFVAVLFTPSVQPELGYAVALTLIGAAVLAVVALAAYVSLMMAGAKPFPTAPDSNLPSVLKALHLQRAFTRFAIDNQMHAAGSDAASAQKLYDAFATFVADNKPNDVGGPTQAAGVIGI